MSNRRPLTMITSDLMPEKLSEHMGRRFVQMSIEAIVLMALALLFPFSLGIDQGGMIALFLVSASLTHRAKQLMEENRVNIWLKQRGSWVSNQISALSILSIFIGLFLTHLLFSLVMVLLGRKQALHQFYAFILKTQHLVPDQGLALRFSGFLGILLNNCVVLLTTVLLTFVYRTFGMALVISWNACIWAVVLFAVFRHAFLRAKVGAGMFLLQVIPAMLPHLLLEALAYILAALSAIFFSHAYSKYNTSDKRFHQVLRACLILLFYACLTVVAAAMCEAVLPRLLLKGL